MPSPKRKHTRPAPKPPGITTSAKGLGRQWIIDDESMRDPSMRDLLFRPIVNGEVKGMGLIPRRHHLDPPQMFDPPSGMPLVPRSEWSERIKERKAQGRMVYQMLKWPSLDQNGHGYCWAYSTVGAVMCVRTLNNQPYVRLNPHSVAAVIKRGKDEGGWCGLSAKFLREVGVASEQFWPGHSRDYQRLEPQARANYGLHKVTEEWVDLTRNVYDQDLTLDQLFSAFFAYACCAGDDNDWSHSTVYTDPDEVEPGSYGRIGRNSWTDGWGFKNQHGVGGFFVRRGNKLETDGALAIRVTGASAT